ncbi:MAG: hypothetical protein ABIH11_07195 [Candidatus Altiarchaeota archaeon]
MGDKPILERQFNEDLDIEAKLGEGGVIARLYLEVQGNDKEAAQKALESTIFEKMNSEPMMDLLEAKLYDIEESEDKKFFSGVAEVKLIADDFRSFINVSMRYGPTAIEIIEPDEVSLDLDKMHAIAGDVSSMMQLFSNQIISMLKDPERAALYRQMIEKEG